MNKEGLIGALNEISKLMTEESSHLTELDSKFGDGDLGLSMDKGFRGVCAYLKEVEGDDLGVILRGCSMEFNESAPSTLGTILSFGFMGMAKVLRGKNEVEVSEIAEAMDAGVSLIMEKAKSKPGDKTILDSLVPAIEALKSNVSQGAEAAFLAAYEAAREGMEGTGNMRAIHGRAAHHGDKTLGVIDGGATAGMLIFKALNTYIQL